MVGRSAGRPAGRPGFNGTKTNSAQTEAGARAELGKNDHEVVYYMVAPVPDQSVARPNRACLTGLLITNLQPGPIDLGLNLLTKVWPN